MFIVCLLYNTHERLDFIDGMTLLEIIHIYFIELDDSINTTEQ